MFCVTKNVLVVVFIVVCVCCVTKGNNTAAVVGDLQGVPQGSIEQSTVSSGKFGDDMMEIGIFC